MNPCIEYELKRQNCYNKVKDIFDKKKECPLKGMMGQCSEGNCFHTDYYCEHCGNKIDKDNKEKRDVYRDTKYCEVCSDDYWDCVRETEGVLGMDR